MVQSSLSDNIGRLFVDPDGTSMSVIVDVIYEDGKYKYVYFMLKRGEMLTAYVKWFDNAAYVKWLTPPRQNRDASETCRPQV